jgi:hypothetical protein
MTPQGSDSIDFKPFFDMVVGILFILLILIAAQLFFSRFESDSPEAQAQQKRAARAAEQELFLNGVAIALTKAGFPANVDRAGNRITVPLAALSIPESKVSPISPWRAPDSASTTRFSAVLSGIMACAGLDLTAVCTRHYDVSLTQADFVLNLGGLASGQTPSPQAQVLGMQMEAALFAPAPQILNWNGAFGTALFSRTVAIMPVAGSTESSTLAVEFVYAP